MKNWPKVIGALASVLSVLSVTGAASAAWTKSGSGTGATGAVILGTPGSFTATCDSSSSAQVDFTWTIASFASGYSLLDSTSVNGTYTVFQTVSGGTATSANSGTALRPGNSQTLYFKIEATVGTNWTGNLSSSAGPRTLTHNGASNYTCS